MGTVMMQRFRYGFIKRMIRKFKGLNTADLYVQAYQWWVMWGEGPPDDSMVEAPTYSGYTDTLTHEKYFKTADNTWTKAKVLSRKSKKVKK